MREKITLLVVALIVSSPALAQDYFGDSQPGGAPAAQPPQGQGVVPGASAIETQPPPPVNPPQVAGKDIDPNSSLAYAPILQGFFLELEPAVAFTLGGSKAFSDVAPYIGIDTGYDILGEGAVGLNLAYIGSAGSSRGDFNAAPQVDSNYNGALTDFTMVMADIFFQYRIPVGERMAVPVDLVAGVTLLDPNNKSVAETDQGLVADIDPLGANSDAANPNINFGIQTGYEYYSYMLHFNMGVEVAFYYITPTNIPVLAIYPTLRYTF